MSTEIKPCTCTQKPGTTGGADYQDKLYGKGMRACNCVTTAKGKESRCTVCGIKK